jgi:hypothetical protein
MDPVKTVTSAFPSVSTLLKFAVLFIVFNAALELIGYRDWFYAPISAWRNRNGG